MWQKRIPEDAQGCYGWHTAGSVPAHDYVVPEVLRLVGTQTKTACRVIDLGCGNGFVAGVLSRAGHQVVGIDVSEDGLNLAREAHPGVTFLRASVYEDGLARSIGHADVVLALEVVEHLYFPTRLFNLAFQILEPDGLLIASTPYHGYLKNLAIALMGRWDRHWEPRWEGGHIKFFSRATLSSMLHDSGFAVEKIVGVGRVPGLWKSMIVMARPSNRGSDR